MSTYWYVLIGYIAGQASVLFACYLGALLGEVETPNDKLFRTRHDGRTMATGSRDTSGE